MKCKTCGAELDPTNSFCECGTPVPEPSPRPPTSNPTGMTLPEQKKQCPFCSEEILATATKCKHCGSMLNEPPPTVEPPATTSMWTRLFWIIVTLLALSIGAYWFASSHKSCDQKYQECKARAIGWAGAGVCDINYNRCKQGQEELR